MDFDKNLGDFFHFASKQRTEKNPFQNFLELSSVEKMANVYNPDIEVSLTLPEAVSEVIFHPLVIHT